MTKRKRPTQNLDVIETVFDRIAAAASKVENDTSTTSDGTLASLLIRMKSKILSAALDQHQVKKARAAKEFTIEEAVEAFGLKYSTVMSVENSIRHTWKIQDVPDARNFQMTPCLASLVENYSKNFERSSEAVCRTAVDFILNECLTKGNHKEPGIETTTDHGRKTPTTPWDDIKIYGEVSFSHTITPRTSRTSTAFQQSVISVTGRVDYGIGRILRSPTTYVMKQLRRRFQSLLLIVEAKVVRSVDQALPQLFVYLASLHQSRLQRGRSDASVYGVASDGYVFIFVTISHDGAVKLSRRFDITQGDLPTVLGCFKYILETSPNLTPERLEAVNVDGEDVDDQSLDVDDNDYMDPPQDDEPVDD